MAVRLDRERRDIMSQCDKNRLHTDFFSLPTISDWGKVFHFRLTQHSRVLIWSLLLNISAIILMNKLRKTQSKIVSYVGSLYCVNLTVFSSRKAQGLRCIDVLVPRAHFALRSYASREQLTSTKEHECGKSRKSVGFSPMHGSNDA